MACVACLRVRHAAQARIVDVVEFARMCKGVIAHWLPASVDTGITKMSRGKGHLASIQESMKFLVEMETQTALEILWMEGVRAEVAKELGNGDGKSAKRKRSLKVLCCLQGAPKLTRTQRARLRMHSTALNLQNRTSRPANL